MEIKAAFIRPAHVYFGAVKVSSQTFGQVPAASGLRSIAALGREVRVGKRLSESEVSLWRLYSDAGIWTDREYDPAAPPDDVREAGERFAAARPGTAAYP